MSTRCEIHAPGFTKSSAAASCFGSSRTSKRTRTLVSTARMAGPHMLPDAFLEILEASRLGLLREQRPVEILEGVASNASDRDAIILGVPLQDRSWDEREALANLGWN